MKFYLKTWFIILLVIFSTGLFFGLIYLSDIATKAELQSQKKATPLLGVDTSTIKNQESALVPDPIRLGAPYFGNQAAKITIVEFSDFQCPFCKEASYILKQVFEKYGDRIYFQYRHFPIVGVHQYATGAAEASMCANEQGLFWEYHDLIFDNQEIIDTDALYKFADSLPIDGAKFKECADKRKYKEYVEADLEEGLRLGVRATPTFFVEGRRIQGVLPFDVWDKVIRELSN